MFRTKILVKRNVDNKKSEATVSDQMKVQYNVTVCHTCVVDISEMERYITDYCQLFVHSLLVASHL